MKKYSVTFLEDHRSRQELIASILRREADIERKKAIDMELLTTIQAQKAAAEQLVVQKSLDAAREKSQRAVDAVKEQRALDAAYANDQRLLDQAKRKDEQALGVKKDNKFEVNGEIEQVTLFFPTARVREAPETIKEGNSESYDAEERMRSTQHEHVAPRTTALQLQQPQLSSQNQKSKARDTKIRVPCEDSELHLKKFDGKETKMSCSRSVLCNMYVAEGIVPPSIASEMSILCSKFDSDDAYVQNELLQLNRSASNDQSSCESFEVGSNANFFLSSAPCQSPRSVEETPRFSSPGVMGVNIDKDVVPHQATFDSRMLSELHRCYGPWRPFVSSSRHLQPVDEEQRHLSPYELALNVSCMDALNSLPALHGTTTSKKKLVDTLCKDVICKEVFAPKHLSSGNSLSLYHVVPSNAKLLQDLNFEEAQLDRALRALRRFSSDSYKSNLCVYEEILQYQRKLMSLLLPLTIPTDMAGNEQISKSPFFNISSFSHSNSESQFDNQFFCKNSNCLPLKTNLASLRRQILLAKSSSSRFSLIESLSSNSADVLHLESMAKLISSHNHGDPNLWKSVKQKVEPSKLQQRCTKNNDRDIVVEIKNSFGSANHSTKSLLLGNFAQDMKSSLSRSFQERYSAAGRSVKR
jgi:hypothetical protein